MWPLAHPLARSSRASATLQRAALAACTNALPHHPAITTAVFTLTGHQAASLVPSCCRLSIGGSCLLRLIVVVQPSLINGANSPLANQTERLSIKTWRRPSAHLHFGGLRYAFGQKLSLATSALWSTCRWRQRVSTRNKSAIAR